MKWITIFIIIGIISIGIVGGMIYMNKQLTKMIDLDAPKVKLIVEKGSLENVSRQLLTGKIESSTFLIENNVTGDFLVRLDINSLDMENSSKVVIVWIYAFDGKEWYKNGGFEWRGEKATKDEIPEITLNVEDLRSKTMKVEIESKEEMNLGYAIEIK